jgi:hypothetical protein
LSSISLEPHRLVAQTDGAGIAGEQFADPDQRGRGRIHRVAQSPPANGFGGGASRIVVSHQAADTAPGSTPATWRVYGLPAPVTGPPAAVCAGPSPRPQRRSLNHTSICGRRGTVFPGAGLAGDHGQVGINNVTSRKRRAKLGRRLAGSPKSVMARGIHGRDFAVGGCSTVNVYVVPDQGQARRRAFR